METIIGDSIGATIGIHSPFPTKHQTVAAFLLQDSESRPLYLNQETTSST